jgi:hypothetical protein
MGYNFMNGLVKRGAFLLSIDTELGESPAGIQLSREAIARLLELMERYQIRATWAVLGRMLLDQPLNGVPSQYDKDIVKQILTCGVPQEIGCHTFSHIRVGAPSCSRECFESELRACQSAAEKIGVTLQSFVFPWNSVGHLDSLRKYGFITYRGPSPIWFAGLPIPLRRLAHLLDHLLLIPPPVVMASCEMGVWNLPASYFYVCGAGWGKMIPISLRVNKVKKGLRLAARKRRLFHLWFHPFNLASNPQLWLKGLESVFAEVCRYRETGLLENPTMGELARELQNSTHEKNTVSQPSSLACGGGL